MAEYEQVVEFQEYLEPAVESLLRSPATMPLALSDDEAVMNNPVDTWAGPYHQPQESGLRRWVSEVLRLGG